MDKNQNKNQNQSQNQQQNNQNNQNQNSQNKAVRGVPRRLCLLAGSGDNKPFGMFVTPNDWFPVRYLLLPSGF